MINTHEKLMEQVLNQEMSGNNLYEELKEIGYKGTKEKMVTSFLCAIRDTDAYIEDPRKVFGNEILTQEEYFEMLVSKMNELEG